MSIVFPNFVNLEELQKIGRGDLSALTQSIAELDERTKKVHSNASQVSFRTKTDKPAKPATAKPA